MQRVVYLSEIKSYREYGQHFGVALPVQQGLAMLPVLPTTSRQCALERLCQSHEPEHRLRGYSRLCRRVSVARSFCFDFINKRA